MPVDQHQILCAIKDLACELGHTPGIVQFSKSSGISERNIVAIFGNWSVALRAAGLDPVKISKAKNIDNSIFNVNIEKHLEEYKPKEATIVPGESFQPTLFIGDVHHPFCKWSVIEAACKFAEIHKPKFIVQGGDLYDMFSHSKFPRSHNAFTPREENNLGREHAEKMWKMLKSAAPKAKCYQLWGNHDVRPLKRVLEVYPSAEDWISKMMTDLMTFDGVETLDSYRDELMLPGNVRVIHGYRSQLGQERDFALCNTVVFHTHVGGTVFKQIRGRVLFEMNGGYAGDEKSKGLSYTPTKTVNWTTGFGWLDIYGPRFIFV